MRKKFAVVLAGSGVYDGSEIHEAILAILAIQKAGAEYQCFAPNIDQHHVINHLTGEEMAETRNVLVESARIARGNVKDLATFSAADFDALMIPGGFGVAKNLSTLAFDGAALQVNAELERSVKAMAAAGKPIGALCIAPAVMTRILEGALVTVGNDAGTIATIEALNGEHEEANHGEVVVDENYKLVSTPCYMLEANIADIEQGATHVVEEIMALLG